MTSGVPRVRMFAGPNGSGKSTLKDVIRPELFGVYVNADEIEQSIQKEGVFDLSAFGLAGEGDELYRFLEASNRVSELKLSTLDFDGNAFSIPPEPSAI